jgi:integration host factor subunit alpha
MTLTKADIIESIIQGVKFKRRYKSQQQFLFPEMDCVLLGQKRASKIVNTFFETIKQTLTRGEDIRISGFGKFQVKLKWARKGRNPQTGEVIILRSRRTVTFRASKKLRKKINSYNPDNDTQDKIYLNTT